MFLDGFCGAFMLAIFMAIIFTPGFSAGPSAGGQRIGRIGEARTFGYGEAGASGMLTLFVHAVMCNRMICTGVVAANMSATVSGKVIAMWMSILIFFYLGFERAIVDRLLFSSGPLLGGNFIIVHYLLWNEIQTIVGNLVGEVTFVGAVIYPTHYETAPTHNVAQGARAATAARVAAE